MNENPTCPNCGKPIAGDAPGGACPSCLLAVGMPAASVPSNPNETMPHEGHFYAPRPDELAEHFPQLEIMELLGHGGMGAVYRARQINLDRIVALKVLTPRLSNDPSFAERFTREARTMAKLNHPNIVTVYDFGQAGQFYFLVMELIDGVNLREAIASQSISPDQALLIVPKVCEALQFAHDQGVIHRDIKPENILLGHRDQVKIADFGLAKLLDPKSREFTLTGTQQVLGTRNYMAPEQIEKPSTVDHRADIYSLGVVFYELLTGELPLGRFSLPSEKAPVSGQLDEVVMRTLEKEPERRFQQASQMKTAVQSIQQPRGESPLESPIQGRAAHGPADSKPDPVDASSQISLPFKIESVHGGLSEAHGIARFNGHHMEFEFRTHTLGITKSNTQVVRIPAGEILRATITRGIFSDRIDFQSDRLDTFDKIPTAVQGGIRLVIDKKNTQFAKQIARQINERIPPQAAEKANVPPSAAWAVGHVPFKITDVYGGFSEAFGIAKATADAVIIEFEIRDGFGITKSAAETVTVPVSDIVRVHFRAGIISDRIDVQASRLDAVTKIPTSTQGKFVLKTKKSDRPVAENFVRHVNQAAGVAPPGESKFGKPLDADLQRTRSIERRLRRPARGLFLVAMVNLVLVCIGTSLFVVTKLPWLSDGTGILQSFMTEIAPAPDEASDVARSSLYRLLHVAADLTNGVSVVGISSVLAVFLILASGRMRKFRSYHFVVAVSILAMIPIHAGFIVGLPIGIWALVILLDPNTRKEFERVDASLSHAPDGKRRVLVERSAEVAQLVRAAVLSIILFVSLLLSMVAIATVLGPMQPSKRDAATPANVENRTSANSSSQPFNTDSSNDDSNSKNSDNSNGHNRPEPDAEASNENDNGPGAD